jgi:VWFA-related protein
MCARPAGTCDRDRSRTVCALGIVLAIAAAGNGLAQVATRPAQAIQSQRTQPPETPVFRTHVDLVEIDVRVVDAKGAPVTDLAAADLDVRENGASQRVAELVRVSRPMPAPSAGPPRDEPGDVTTNYGAADARVYVLVLDDLHIDGRRVLEVRRIGHAFVDRVVAAGDQAAVLYASGRADAAQPFTSNRARLYEAIDRFTGRKLRSATLERQEVYNQFSRGNRGSPRPVDLRDTADQERAANARAALSTLTSATTMLEHIEGRRKAVLIVSEGIDYDISGLSNQAGSPASGMSMTPGPMMTGLDSSTIARALGQVVAVASRANVTFYAIDPRAGDVSDEVAELRAPPDDPSLRVNAQAIAAEKQDAQSTLRGLAAQTGGFAMLSGDLDRIDRIARESSEYYLLRYYPEQPLVHGEFREVDVRVRREGARVSARRGYFARPASTRAAARLTAPGISSALGAALVHPLPSDGLPLRVHAAALKGDRRMAQVVVTTQVPGVLLAPSGVDRLSTTLEVGVLAVQTETGAQTGAGSVVEVALEGPAFAQLKAGDYRVVTRVALAPGRYQLRVGLRDRRTERVGVAAIDLLTPDFADRKATLSGLVLASMVANVAPTAIDEDTARLVPALPTAVRRFTTNDELNVAVEVYGADRGRERLMLHTQVEDEHGRRLIEASTPVSTTPATKGDGASGAAAARDGATRDGTRHSWPVRLRDLAPGRYVVAAELWREASRESAGKNAQPLVRRETRIVVSGGAVSTR